MWVDLRCIMKITSSIFPDSTMKAFCTNVDIGYGGLMVAQEADQTYMY